VVRARDQLRHAGGTTGQQEQSGVGRIDLDARKIGWVARALAADQFVERNKTRWRLAEDDGVLKRWLLFADARDQITEIKVAMPVGSDRADGARNLNELADLQIAMRRQRHHRDGAYFLEREIEISELHTVRELDHETIERVDAEIEQVQSKIGGACIQLRVRDLL